MSAAGQPANLTMWVIYDHPADYPRAYAARKWVGNDATDSIICGNTLDALRDILRAKGLTRLPRHVSDDPVIVETWL